MSRANRFSHGAHDHGGDSERLADSIFEATGAVVRVRLDNGHVQINATNPVDYYLARNFVINTRGYPRENVSKL